ncbi:MAG: hypothetical protein ACJ754_21465 [Pyrinomonadaceae bacterium]
MRLNKSPCKWRHFEPSLILLCVRWSCHYRLSYRDLDEAYVKGQGKGNDDRH